ncbi:MAG TPA: Na+/H+ antiporter NhaA [Solirubrobacterales bacterium]|jgi:NhaA family Na+:H+ antiporter|nr:Na+/H+ antiporter NhaA [Solirubrobacterales bacterium]
MAPKLRPRRAIAVIDPVTRFLKTEEGGGFALLAGSIVALLWVNVFGIGGYESFWHTELTIGIGAVSISEDLGHWVNDGLMTLFFFLISLEIKREVVHGELRRPRQAALPVIAAAGGVAVPILIFLALTAGTSATSGWGIPMATDAAFAIAALALLGDRVGVGAKLFLVTIAVVDDVLAIAVIAIAYTSELSLPWLLGAIGLLAAIVAMRRLGIATIWPYAIVGVLVWIATFESGVHATIAGVALAFLTPARPVGGRRVIEELEERIHPLTSFVVLPVFALANAGVEIGGDALGEGDGARVALAVALGLVVGKLIGISAATMLAMRLRIAVLPEGVDIRSVIGIAALAGIGFTVSLFIAALAYDDPLLVESAKLGILAGSVVSAMVGVALLAPGGRHESRDP